MLLHVFLLKLASGKNHINGASTCAESALTFREVALFEVLQKTIQEYASQDLAGYRKEIISVSRKRIQILSMISG